MGKQKNLIGKVFNMLTVIERSGTDRNGNVTWLCECSCGNHKVYSNDHLTRKHLPVKSCGCIAIRKGPNHPQWNGFGDISGNWWCSHVLRERNQTSRSKIPVNITMEYAWNLFLKQDRRCVYTGMQLEISNTSRYGTASIDRIDSSKGYICGNIQWVHKHVNFMKRTFTHEYFIRLCKMIAENHSTNQHENDNRR